MKECRHIMASCLNIIGYESGSESVFRRAVKHYVYNINCKYAVTM